MHPLPHLDRVAGHDVLFVMAVAPEYGPHLRSRITPLMTGVGPVEAAVVLTRALAALGTAQRSPALVVSLGSAGSRRLEQAQVYQVSQVEYRDMDASALGFPKGQTPFLDLPISIPLPQFPGLPTATLATGASIVSGAGYDATNADMVDMETFAILRACQHFGIPLVGLRGISDGAEELSHVDDWTQYLHLVDRRLSDALDLLEQALREGFLRKDR